MALKGDFTGFTFNGKHSSDLGITRVSEGSRYSDDLLPTIEDKTVPVPGGDGVYYFGSYYRQKNFNIQIAFDDLTEKQLKELKSHFGKKQLGDLIFDETPYKVYKVKITGTPNLKYICFDEYVDGAETPKRVYKGEGTIQFVAFSPFARSRFRTLKEFKDELYPNKSEWAEASGMPTSFNFNPRTVLSTIEDENGNEYEYIAGYELYYCNPGDMDTDFTIKIKFVNGVINVNKIELYSIVDELGTQDSTEELTFSAPIAAKPNGYNTFDDAILIDSKLNIIQGLKGEELTGNVYNEYIANGNFFKLPIHFYSSDPNQPYIGVSSFLDSVCPKPTLNFNYLYY